MGLENNYYTSKQIRKENAHYNLVYSGRSNGKTYDGLTHIVSNYVNSGYKKQGAIIRRWREDLRPARADEFFSGIVENGYIKDITKGLYDSVKFRSNKFFLAKYIPGEDKYRWANEPFAYAFALSNVEHDKSTSYPRITEIVFDEFLTRYFYLQNEASLFMNVLSTIVRDRIDWKCFFMGNTVSKYSPYFQLFDIDIKQLKIGDIKTFDRKGKKIAVEYAPMRKKEPGQIDLLDFGTGATDMITSGAWEVGAWPCIKKPNKKRSYLAYFEIQGVFLECSMYTDDDIFLFVEPATQTIKENTLTITTTPKPGKNYVSSFRHVNADYDKLLQTLHKCIKTQKIFFDSNDTGEVMLNFIHELATVPLLTM